MGYGSADLLVCQLGTVPYREALALQGALREARQADAVPDLLLLLDHPPVYTRGRRSRPEELPGGDAGDIEVVDVDRGGRMTYHGPGLLTGYPIMRVDDVLAFLRTMERAIIAALADAGLEGHSAGRPTGVWVGEEKIASMGLHVARGVTTHGFAVNVDNDLAPWEAIVACGLHGVRMTSVARATGRPGPLMPAFREAVARRFAEAHGRRPRHVALEDLPVASVV